ncbi:hypothetical protein KSX_68260 [Ktedonospora formicarum]|uniref:Uncharacterized protein n=1 Tax=Ktedonospora formicarum TaxID=2778364 RepID=A0A8J3IAE5_9CHLR|nr:hypothetical protein KSX_68260 [Ktedonospora formicarum]
MLDLLLQEVRYKRRYAFGYMDVYVRNRHKTARDELSLSSSWLRQSLAMYSNTVIPNSTFNDWITKGAIRLERKGRPHPQWAAATFIARMIDDGERSFLPEKISLDEPPFWCYGQSPQGAVIIIPVTEIHQQPKNTILWTNWPGAIWDDDGWLLIGEGEDCIGAIRFAGVRKVRDHLYWDVSLEDIRMWDAEVAALFLDFDGNTIAQIQSLATLALHRLARERIKL